MKEIKGWNLAMNSHEFELGKSSIGVVMLNPEFIRSLIVDDAKNRLLAHPYLVGMMGENSGGEQPVPKTLRLEKRWRNHRKNFTIKDFQSVRVGSYKF